MNPTAEALLRLILSGGENAEWPLPAERPILERLNTYAAIRESNRDQLQRVVKWDSRRLGYRVDPLGERIADAWAQYLYGEDPTVTPAQDSDADAYANLITANSFASELERAGGLCVSEGEIWARLYVDELAAPVPLLEWVSRRHVLPLWQGPRLAGAAVVTELPRRTGDEKATVCRHFELHTPGRVDNLLYVGRDNRVGEARTLDEHPATAELVEGWDTNLAGLAVERMPNRLRETRRLGVSDYHGITDFLFDLNEAAVIGAHNARLTARKRAVVQASAIRRPQRDLDDLDGEGTGSNLDPVDFPRARFDAAEEVFVDDPVDRELGRESKDPMRIIEYSFDAERLIVWKRDLVETALSRVGLTGQFVGNTAGDTGYAISGTALRLRLIPTDKTGRSKGRYPDDVIPRVLANMARLDASLFGTAYADTETEPTYTRRPGLPVDDVEEAQRHRDLVGAGLESKRTAIEDLHPEWTTERVDEELDRLKEEAPPPGAAPGGMFGAGF